MAGYVISMGDMSESELLNYISKGVYGTKLKIKNEQWSSTIEGTLADYYSMKPGDHIYFFRKRKIYGVGRLVNLGNHDCKILNFQDADFARYSNESTEKMIIPNENIRFICTFKPDPSFFVKGLDMDVVLHSNPSTFRMLRAFWKVSFIKVDEIEDKALFDILLRENQRALNSTDGNKVFNYELHNKIESISSTMLNISSKKIISQTKDIINNDSFRREMGFEAAMISYLMSNDYPFGNWDYLSHQVIASPFKPIDYMDKMDIFGYRNIQGYNTISKYLVMELKRNFVGIEVLNQVMKYVDWINQEYAHGDFEMIEAYIVGYEFSDEVIKESKKIALRNFTKDKPAMNRTWKNLRLFKYKITSNNDLEFIEIV